MIEETTKPIGIGFSGLLALIFITLKLTGVINWSWWWVLAPLWGRIVILLAICLCILLVAGFAALVGWGLSR